jgi:hypothetical protein
MVKLLSTSPWMSSWPSPEVTSQVPLERGFKTSQTTSSGESVQSGSQPSLGKGLPSSHSSPGSRLPSPQKGPVSIVHVAEQPSPSSVLPSSQSSSGSTTPSPQLGLVVSWVHVAEHPSPSAALPSSHSSAGSTLPSPQNDDGFASGSSLQEQPGAKDEPTRMAERTQ